MDEKFEKQLFLRELGVPPFQKRTYDEYEPKTRDKIKDAVETLKKYEIFDEKANAEKNELYRSQDSTLSQIKEDYKTFLLYFFILYGGMVLMLLIEPDLRNFSFIWKYFLGITVMMFIVVRHIVKTFKSNDYKTNFISKNYYNL